MAMDVHLRGIRRRPLDEDKLAMSFLMLAKIVAEEEADPRNGEER